MDSSAKAVPKQCDTYPAGRYLSSGRTPSFSSSSSSFSPSSSLESFYFHDDTLISPATPLRFSGVPFSWEHLPGIPKKQNSKKKQEKSSMKLLPLPPPTTTTTTTHSSKKLTHEETRIRKKNTIKNSLPRDPFFAALVECSKDDHEETSSSNFWNGAKVSRSISDRFGFISLYGSCKRTCAVSESLVYLPSSRRSTYEHVSRRFL